MLNISNYKVEEAIKKHDLKAFSHMTNPRGSKLMSRLLLGVSLIFLVILFLPWTQNIQGKGKITTLQPEHRPQTIHSIIPGRVVAWHVKEGQKVNKGDTIITIGEIKPEYLDPSLLARVKEQLDAKEQSIESYASKVASLKSQISALEQGKALKVSQTENKLQQELLKLENERANYNVADTSKKIALRQFNSYKSLYEQGIISLTDYEAKRKKLQEADAKLVSAENKVRIYENSVNNTRIELNAVRAEYDNKLAKSSSDLFSAESMLLDNNAQVLKIRNQYSNYQIRSGYYQVVAPQDCYITKAIVPGIGEIVKEGQAIATIMPSDYDLAVELYVEPLDYPLVHVGEKVQLLFDGWPFIVFSGWPNASFGTYSGHIVAIDQNISSNGKYRILIKPAEGDNPWPEALRVGSGAKGMALLNNVYVFYELWRQISGFPPDYYAGKKEEEKKEYKAKAKVKY